MKFRTFIEAEQGFSLSGYFKGLGLNPQVNGNAVIVNNVQFTIDPNSQSIDVNGQVKIPFAKFNDPKVQDWIKQAVTQQQGAAKYQRATLTQPGQSPNTFNGQPLSSIKSPSGAPVVTKFYTAQGSEYIIASDGAVQRIKSDHSNMGGSDAGLHNWSQKAIFTSGKDGESFNVEVARLLEMKNKLSLQFNGNTVNAFILDKSTNQWRQAVWQDAHPQASQQPAYANKLKNPLSVQFSPTPQQGWNILDFNARQDGTIKSIHPGSPVSHIEQSN